MLIPTVALDFSLINSVWACLSLSSSVYNTKPVPARPQTPTTLTHQPARTTLFDKILKTITILVPSLYYALLILGLLSLQLTCLYEYTPLALHINSTNHTWVYVMLILLILIIASAVYNARLQTNYTSSETTVAMIFIFLCAQFYYYITNPFALIVLLECQGAALLLLLTTTKAPEAPSRASTTNITIKLQKSTVAINMLTLQFWIAFFGAALLLTGTAWLVFTIGAAHWYDLTHLLALDRYTTQAGIVVKLGLMLLLVGLLLKTSVFPFHFWKPELYVNLHMIAVWIYALPYTIAVTFLVIFLLNILVFISPTALKLFILINTLSATYILLAVLLFVTEIKAFLAYTSGLHIVYVYVAILIDTIYGASATLYTLAYALATTTAFTALLNFKQLSVKYITDLQIYAHLPTQVFWLSTGIATMAGVPPLLGFWVKFIMLIGLWLVAEIILASHLLSLSMAYMYFYISLYRFSGAANFKVNPQRLHSITTPTIALLGTSSTALNLTGVWHVNDLANYSTLLALHLHDYI